MEKDEKLPPAGAPQPQPQPPLGDDAAKHMDASDLTLDSDLETAVEGVTPASRDDERKYLAGVQMWLVMSSLITASFLVLLDNAIVATAIPKITSQFHSLEDISWYGSAFQLASAAIQPLVGKIYTQFRLKHVYLAFFFIFELGSLICGVATSSTMLIVGRAVAGIGVAGVFAGALIIIGVAVRPEQRAFLTGICIGCAQLGIVIGPLIGGALTEKVSWRWCFYINLPLGAIVLGGTLFVTIADQTTIRPVRDVLPTLHRSLDLVGFLLLSPSAVMLLLALQWGGSVHAWSSATIIGLFCGAGVLFLVFVAWEWRKGPDALIPTPVVRNRVVVAACLVAMTVMGATFLTSYWMPVYFQTVRGKSPLTSGVYMLPNILPSLVFGVLTGFLIGKVGYYLPFAVAGGALTSVATGLLSTLRPDSSTGHWVGFQVLLGAARGLVQQTSFIAIPHATTPALVPTAMSMSIFCQYMGGAVFLSLANVIFSSSLRSELPIEAPGVDPRLIVEAGAYAVRDVGIPAELLPGVLRAYCTSVNRVFYLASAVSVLLFVTACCSGWVDTRKKNEANDGSGSGSGSGSGESSEGQSVSEKTEAKNGL
ncbi:MFS transporter [Purpureocillium lilacinum]|uniref:MFS transporter n=1 Tax=Purpureocillium lilacinum TaxID=33203 RepID=A0A179HPZ5_PURLI|nr:MFS transporter [Purpureocillium lilacinum]OAQ92417.1 MFS transporter [Purpureocillium lilacinum]